MLRFSSRLMAGFRFLLLLILMAGAALGGYFFRSWESTQKVPAGIMQVDGRIAAFTTQVTAPISGQIAAFLVKPGQTVHAGQIIARLDDRISQARLQAVRADLSIERQKRAMTSAYLEPYIEAQQLAEINLKRQQLQKQIGKENVKQLSLAQKELQQTTARTKAGRTRLTAHDQRLAKGEAHVQKLKAQIQAKQIRAPIPGQIGALLATEGNALAKGDPILLIQDPGRLYLPLPEKIQMIEQVTMGSIARIIVETGSARILNAVLDAIVGPVPTVTGEEGPLALILTLDENEVRPIGIGRKGIGFIRLDPEASWPIRVR